MPTTQPAITAFMAGFSALSEGRPAVAAFRAAVSLAPGWADAYNGLAGADPAQAWGYVLRAILLAPANSEYWLNRAVLAIGRGSAAAAAHALDAAAAGGADPAICTWLRGDLAEATGRPDDAAICRLHAFRGLGAATPTPAGRILGVGLEIGGGTGWGQEGFQIARHLETSSRAALVSVLPRRPDDMPRPGGNETETRLRQATAARSRAVFASLADRVDGRLPFDAVVPLGNAMVATPRIGRPRQLFGRLALEDTRITPAMKERAKRFDLLLPTSTWVTETIRANGIGHCETLVQGMDVDRFRPRPRTGRWPGRFVVFSGGKLELRKGQDLALRAFQRFAARHPDALLVTAWHSPWTVFAQSIALSPHFSDWPGLDATGQLDVAGWLARLGLAQGSYLDAGRLENDAFAALLAEIDIGLFPNRCEGGTNLVAMECMAAEVPVILSNNTGHRDLIAGDNAFVLTRQAPVRLPGLDVGTDGWGESDLEEIVAALDLAYTDGARRAQIGAAGRASMGRIAWSRQIDRLLDIVGL